MFIFGLSLLFLFFVGIYLICEIIKFIWELITFIIEIFFGIS